MTDEGKTKIKRGQKQRQKINEDIDFQKRRYGGGSAYVFCTCEIISIPVRSTQTTLREKSIIGIAIIPVGRRKEIKRFVIKFELSSRYFAIFYVASE